MGAIVNIFKAIFGGIFGLFSKKKDGFYMEAAPAEAAPANAAAPAPAPAVESNASNGKVAKTSKTSAKKGEAKPAVAAVQKATAAPEPLDLINAALAASKAATEEAAAAAGGFADKYMIPLPLPTRRPGANMAMYKSMAKDMKRF
ncbi:MAG: hypothetical protein HC860_05230 [Alkalinema sp. RU_4_3]|nr:hypothetical protein [Alkalinema sp. RU_4_3]